MDKGVVSLMDMIKIVFGMSDNILAPYLFYITLGIVIGSIYHYKSLLELNNQSYTTKDGNVMTHEDVIRVSRKYAIRVYDSHPSCPLLIVTGLTMHNMAFFMLPGFLYATRLYYAPQLQICYFGCPSFSDLHSLCY